MHRPSNQPKIIKFGQPCWWTILDDFLWDRLLDTFVVVSFVSLPPPPCFGDIELELSSSCLPFNTYTHLRHRVVIYGSSHNNIDKVKKTKIRKSSTGCFKFGLNKDKPSNMHVPLDRTRAILFSWGLEDSCVDYSTRVFSYNMCAFYFCCYAFKRVFFFEWCLDWYLSLQPF